jgi:trehalose/maltose transport system permease protein
MTDLRPELDLRAQRARTAIRFLAPMVLALALVAGWPLARSFWFAFTDTSLSNIDGGQWIGIRNYLSWRTLESGRTIWRGTLVDPVWWAAVRNTLVFAFTSVALEAVLGVIVALVLNARFPLRGLVRAAVLIPWAIPTIVSARMWGWLLNDQFGMVNDLLLRAGVLTQKVAWTVDPGLSMASVILVDVWKTTPFVALLVLAALQMVPRDMYEAARIDGVHPVRVFFRVTLPLIRPALIVALIFRMLDALRVFDVVYVLTANSPSTKTMSIVARENMIDFDRFAYGSAQSTLLFFLVALIAVLTIYLGRLKLEGDAR